jgi:hypothetical protein
MKCANCIYFERWRKELSNKGSCLRCPPVVIGLSDCQDAWTSITPETYPWGWCGEYKAREEEKADES